jgi:uncharacterized protein (TIGR03492 family)
VASNGHGEDGIARRILEALERRGVPLSGCEAWAMVGQGSSFDPLRLRRVGPTLEMPSEGFGTVDARAFLRDLRAGWAGAVLRQAQFARRLRGRVGLWLAVGDVVPLAAGLLAGATVLFFSSAKSAHYGGAGHNAIERALMRRCAEVWVRDALTAEPLAATGVRCRWLGNPMMDGLDGPALSLPAGRRAVAMLAGSRRDATENAAFLLRAIAEMRGEVLGLFANHAATDHGRLCGLAGTEALPGWRVLAASADEVRMAHRGGAEAWLLHRGFAAVLRSAEVSVGMAGTANEQAVGLGLPLVAVPGAEVQGEGYLRMKMPWFGPAAMSAPREERAVADAVRALLADPERRARMAAAGRERMGPPGASDRIAADIAERMRAAA